MGGEFFKGEKGEGVFQPMWVLRWKTAHPIGIFCGYVQILTMGFYVDITGVREIDGWAVFYTWILSVVGIGVSMVEQPSYVVIL